MKKYILIATASLLIFGSCNQEEKKQLEVANRTNDSLRQIVGQRDAELNDFISSFNAIESNLHEIARQDELDADSVTSYPLITARTTCGDGIARA